MKLTVTERAGSWRIRKMVRGQMIDRVLGRVADMTQAQAEAAAYALVLKVQSDGPAALRSHDASAIRNGSALHNGVPTLGELAYSRLEHGLRHGTRKTDHRPWKDKTIKIKKSMLRQPRAEELLCLPIDQIDRDKIRGWYSKHLNKGVDVVALENLVRELSTVFSWAIDEGWVNDNPFAQLMHSERFVRARPKDRRLNIENGSLALFLEALTKFDSRKATSETVKHAILFTLLYATRAEETFRLQWSFVDWELDRIIAPGVKKDGWPGTKNRNPINLQLTNIVRTMLRYRREKDPKGRFIFPGRSGADQPLTSVRSSLAALCRKAGVEEVSIHDLRRTASQVAVYAGEKFLNVKSYLRHSATSGDVTLGYISQHPIPTLGYATQLQVADFIGKCLPGSINGEAMSGTVRLEGKRHILNSAFDANALEFALFNPVCRKGENGRWQWVEHDGIEDTLIGL